MDKYMQEAINEAKINENNNFKGGGPFGAIIVKDGKIIARAHNSVIASHDSTAHAEINAIRKASQMLQTHNLSGCTIYTSCFPCPMCLSAIVWANIKEVYYACSKEDADKIGFQDDKIYELLCNLNNNQTVNFTQIDREEAIKSFEEFQKKPNLY